MRGAHVTLRILTRVVEVSGDLCIMVDTGFRRGALLLRSLKDPGQYGSTGRPYAGRTGAAVSLEQARLSGHSRPLVVEYPIDAAEWSGMSIGVQIFRPNESLESIRVVSRGEKRQQNGLEASSSDSPAALTYSLTKSSQAFEAEARAARTAGLLTDAASKITPQRARGLMHRIRRD